MKRAKDLVSGESCYIKSNVNVSFLSLGENCVFLIFSGPSRYYFKRPNIPEIIVFLKISLQFNIRPILQV